VYPLVLHKNLTLEKWSAYLRPNQILMIAAELNRAGNWMDKRHRESVRRCDERAFELVDLTLEDPKWKGGAGELLRFRELLAQRYAAGSMDRALNGKLFRVLVQLHPESASAAGQR
jgi:hypothetical protein